MNDTLRHAWQSAGTDAALPSLDAIRAQADRLYGQVHRRNRIETIAAAFVVVSFGLIAVFMPVLPMRIGAGLIVAGALFVTWQLHRRASAETPPDAGTEPVLAHQRKQLVRQRDALESIALWYLAPLVPGLALILATPALHGWDSVGLAGWLRIAIAPLTFAGIWWLNRRAAKALQRAIDDLDALAHDG